MNDLKDDLSFLEHIDKKIDNKVVIFYTRHVHWTMNENIGTVEDGRLKGQRQHI